MGLQQYLRLVLVPRQHRRRLATVHRRALDLHRRWTFDSDDPYAWATFHYGRWFYDDDQGWLWYPDTQWAPCWVAWRYSKTHVGWAPLTPDCVWRDDTGLSMGRYNPDTIPLNYYTFCHMNDFAGADLRNHYLLIAKNATYVRRTQFVPGTLRFSNAAVSNELPFHKTLVQAAGHDFQRAHLVTVDVAQNRGAFGNELRVFRPEVTLKRGRVPQFIGTETGDSSARQPLEPQGLARFQRNRTDTLQQDHLFETQTPPDNASRERSTNSTDSSCRPSRKIVAEARTAAAPGPATAPSPPDSRTESIRSDAESHVPRAEATRTEAALHPAPTDVKIGAEADSDAQTLKNSRRTIRVKRTRIKT